MRDPVQGKLEQNEQATQGFQKHTALAIFTRDCDLPMTWFPQVGVVGVALALHEAQRVERLSG
jgi:hypothetical protein